MAYERVFSSLRIADAELPNRLVRSAAATTFGGPYLTQELIDFEVSHARGGVGLLILGDASIHPTCPAPLLAYDDAIVPGYERLMRAIRPYGTRVFQQLWHCGSCYPNPDGTPPWSCSPIPSPSIGVVPTEMSIGQIEELVSGFAAAARRCHVGGLDGIEVHGGHGYLFQQFLSPLSNTRTDAYGGSFTNRLRFTLQVMAAIRAAVVPGFAVGIRLSSQGFAGGLGDNDLIAIVKALQSAGLADFVNFSEGSYAAVHKILGGMLEPPGYQIQSNRLALAMTTVPRVVNGRFGSLEQVDQILASGQADLVGMTRALIADPDLPRKSRRGASRNVRPCIACNEGCIGGLSVGRMRCSINAAVGRERELEDGFGKATNSRLVLIAGAGPAGMEAARIAAERGHRVILAEERHELGGQLAFARRAPGYEILGDFVDWQVRELERLGVEIRRGLKVDYPLAEKLGPNDLVVAIGSRPRMDGVHYNYPGRTTKGVEQSHVVSSWTVLAEPTREYGDHVLISDDTGHHEAAAIAAFFVASGRAVTFVTTHSQFLPALVGSLAVPPLLERLTLGKFTLRTRVSLQHILADTVTIEPIDGGTAERHRADTVVLVSPNLPNCIPDRMEADSPVKTFIIGDASSPRFLGTAIDDAFRVGMIV
jgi:2,4-dienoyl-CoA reductase-like NADH-dependent reductase (Old Yellow Enzyme family)